MEAHPVDMSSLNNRRGRQEPITARGMTMELKQDTVRNLIRIISKATKSPTVNIVGCENKLRSHLLLVPLPLPQPLLLVCLLTIAVYITKGFWAAPSASLRARNHQKA